MPGNRGAGERIGRRTRQRPEKTGGGKPRGGNIFRQRHEGFWEPLYNGREQHSCLNTLVYFRCP